MLVHCVQIQQTIEVEHTGIITVPHFIMAAIGAD